MKYLRYRFHQSPGYLLWDSRYLAKTEAQKTFGNALNTFLNLISKAEAEANVTCVTFVAVNIHAGIFSLAFLCGCGWKKAQTDLRQQ